MSKSDTDKRRGGKPRDGRFRPAETGSREGSRPRFSKPRREDAPREGDERPRFRKATAEGEGFEKPRRAPRFSAPDGDRPPRKPRFEDREGGTGERPFRARPPRDRAEGDQRPDRPPRKPRFEGREGGTGERPFRARPPRDRAEGDQRPDRPPRKPRFEGREGGTGERPFRARPPRDRAEGDQRPDRPPRKPRFEGREGGTGERPFRSRNEGDRPFRSRADGDAARAPRFRDERSERPRKPRFESERPARAPQDRASRERAGSTGISAEGERIARVMARAGLCSRRDAEDWIAAGRVAVNGAVITSPALDVTPRDQITVDGAPLPEREATRLWLFHKPRGLVTTADDPEGRPTVFEHLPAHLPRVVSVGRLDINTEGLMLLTNDGGLAGVLGHPETGWLRRYRVRVYGEINQADLDILREGITLDGVHYGPIIAVLDREVGDNSWLTMDLREGKNREIKRVLEYLGCQVSRLIRISFGPFQLGDLAEGMVDEVRPRVLADQLGPELAEKAELYLDGPRPQRVAEPGDGAGERPRRFDRRKPTVKRDQAILGEDPTLKVSREKVEDRKGRSVRVERVTRIEDEKPRRTFREDRPREDRRRDDRPRPARSREDGFERPRPPRRDGEDRFERPRPPRREGEDRFEKRGRPFEGRSERAERSSRPDRTDRPDRPDRPPRRPRFEDGAGADRPRGPRRFEERGEDRGRPSGGGFKGPRREGRPGEGAGRPFGGKPGGGRPGGGRPGGRPGGPRDGAPGGGKPRRGPRRED